MSKPNASMPTGRRKNVAWQFLARRGRTSEAESEYKAALRPQRPICSRKPSISQTCIGSWAGKRTSKPRLKPHLRHSPRDAGLHYALGPQVRPARNNLMRRLTRFARPPSLHPTMHDTPTSTQWRCIPRPKGGSHCHACAKRARHPGDRDTLTALVNYNRDAGEMAAALDYAERLRTAFPDDQELARLIDDLRRQSAKPAPN